MRRQNLFYGIVLVICFSNCYAQGPYAPPAGETGSTALAADSSIFSSWASDAVITRGPMNLANLAAGEASVGDQFSPVGRPGENGVVSLGDGGTAVLTFDEPIMNIPGPDFAVFENSFSNDFLELGFVEVSSDGVNFVRFEAVSLTDTNTQVGSFGLIDATNLNNLAGNYRGGYGTPFDLEELKGHVELDVNNITHVKILDVVGCIQAAHKTVDSQGWPVNDPWPTEFASGGFDLDAIGVISTAATGLFNENSSSAISIYPNPAIDHVTINLDQAEEGKITIADLNGRIITVLPTSSYIKNVEVPLPTEDYSPGYYMINYQSKNHQTTKLMIVKGR